MEHAIPVEVRRRESAVEAGPSAGSDLDRVRALARMLDAQFEIAGIRFGLDAIIGLVPLAGDAITTLIALYPIYVAQQRGVGLWTRMRMLGNVALDFGLGAIPLVGDLFDVGFKANLRNLKLLEQALQRNSGPPCATEGR